MKYKAYLRFRPMGQSPGGSFENLDIPVKMLMIDGGTSWLTDFNSADDAHLYMELAEARIYKNIILYLGGTKDHRDMKAVMDLVEIAETGMIISIIMTVESYLNGKMREGVALYEENALLATRPRKALKNTMMATFKLKEPKILQGKVHKHFISYVRREL